MEGRGAHIVMAYILMAHVRMAHTVMAHTVMAHTVMAHMVMAHIVMAHVRHSRNQGPQGREGLRQMEVRGAHFSYHHDLRHGYNNKYVAAAGRNAAIGSPRP